MKSLTESLSMLRLEWDGEVTDQMRNTWFDRREATESGAAGIAILTTLRFTDYTILRRMDIDEDTGEDTGMDYWLGKDSSAGGRTENFLDGFARLEVAGRRATIESALTTEVTAKLTQSKKSDYTGIPAYVVVVGFRKPVVYFETRMARQ